MTSMRRRGILVLLLTLVIVAAGAVAPRWLAMGIDAGIGRGRSGLWTLGLATGGFVAATAVAAVAGAFQIMQSTRLGEDYLLRLRARLVDHVLAMDEAGFRRHPSGRLVSRLTSDVESLQDFADNGLAVMLRAVLTLAVTVVALFSLSPRLALVALAVLPPLVAATVWFFARVAVLAGFIRDHVARLLQHMAEGLTGAAVVRTYGQVERDVAEFAAESEALRHTTMRVAHLGSLYLPVVELAGPLCVALVLVVGVGMVSNGSIGIGVLVGIVLYVGALFQPVLQLAEQANVLQSAMASHRKVQALLAEKPARRSTRGGPLGPVRGEIVVDSVTFGYEPGRPVLHDVSLRISAGEHLALVGASGSGKSTLARLLGRLHQPTSGRLLLDGRDMADVDVREARRAVLVLPQETFLFDDTVMENLRYFRPDLADDAVVEVCVDLGIDDVIRRFPEGYATRAGSSGATFSGGERQLLAVARALLADPAVLILDETTGSVSPEAEEIVGRAIRRRLRDRTLIVIAHRLSTAMRADRIAVLDHGRLVETGAHAELLGAGGRYAALYRDGAGPDLIGDRPAAMEGTRLR